MSPLSIPRSTPERAVAGLSGRARRLARALLAEWRIRRAMRELDRLDEKMLRDIGLDPGGLEYAARFGRE